MDRHEPFRDDADTLRERHAALTEQLAQAELAAAEADDLRERLKAVDALLHGSTQDLIDQVRFETPCDEDWDRMQGGGLAARHCGRCRKTVYDFTYMTREQIAHLLMDFESPCVRLRRRKDGRVVTADCPPSRRAKTKLMLRVVAATAAAATLVGAAYYVYETQTACRVETIDSATTMGIRGLPSGS